MINLDENYVRTRPKLNKDTVKTLTGYSDQQWLKILGLKSQSISKNLFDLDKDFEIGGHYPTMTIEIINDNIEFSVSIRLASETIYFDHLWLDKKKGGFATSALCDLVDQAAEVGFVQIECLAYRGKGYYNRKYVGYIVWAKLGFTMMFADHQKFCELTARHNLFVTSLQNLISYKTGQKFWRINGFSWQGVFFLGLESINREWLQKYRTLKS